MNEPRSTRDGRTVILAIKMTIAVMLAGGSVVWVIILRATGDEQSYPYLLAVFLFGVGILIGTLWEDERG